GSRAPPGAAAGRRRSLGRSRDRRRAGSFLASSVHGRPRAELRSQHRLDLRRDLAPRLLARARPRRRRLPERLTVATIAIGPVAAPENGLARGALLVLEPRRRAAATAAEALSVERRGIGATATTSASALATPSARAIALAALGEQVLGHGRLLEVLVVGHHRRSARRGDADLGIPDGAERRGRAPRRRRRLLRVLFVVATGGLRSRLLGERTFLAAAAATTASPAP